MAQEKQREFTDKPAVRSKVPLLVGLFGPSGSGKTYSALRVATGIQRVTGGDIFGIDTESNRMLHYADKFKFRHVAFGAPFGPLDYLAAIEYAHKKGAGVIIVDSMSHEHEGPGGVLETHEAETDRLAKLWGVKASVAQMAAWGKPKQDRRRLINTLLQIPCNFIFCFRAKEKLKIKKGEDPKQLGFMPIAGEEFVYEMTVNALLYPSAGGVPTWGSNELGERQMIKLPQQFRDLLLNHGKQEENGLTPYPLDANVGEQMARWAAGGTSDYMALAEGLRDAMTVAALEAMGPKIKKAIDDKIVTAAEGETLRKIYAAARDTLSKTPAAKTSAPPISDEQPNIVETPTDDAPKANKLTELTAEFEAKGGDWAAFFDQHGGSYDEMENSGKAKRAQWCDKVHQAIRGLEPVGAGA